VIVDAAGEHDLRDYFSAGADVAIASAHKNFGALTAGIIAGHASFIESCLLQDAGIGRPMKVGKEGIAGVIAALAEWQRLDRGALHADWTRRAGIAVEVLRGMPSVRVELARDIDGSPLFRARIHVKGGITAEQIANRLVEGKPSIRVWRLGIPSGYFELDPRTVTDDEMLTACRAVAAMLC
jgi:L-seryl-tRNA(Ser) seleniumtransferase